MHRNNDLIDIFYVVNEIGNLVAVLVGQTVAGGVGDVDDGGASGYDGLDHLRQVGVFSTAGVFGIEFDIFHEFPGPFYGLYGSFEYLFAIGIEFAFDMEIRGADPRVDAWVAGFFQGVPGGTWSIAYEGLFC